MSQTVWINSFSILWCIIITFPSRFVRSHLNHNQQNSWHTFMFYNALGTSDHLMKAVGRHSQKCFLTNYFIFYVMVHKWLCFQLNKNQTKALKQFHLRSVLKVLDVSYLWHLGLQLVLCKRRLNQKWKYIGVHIYVNYISYFV